MQEGILGAATDGVHSTAGLGDDGVVAERQPWLPTAEHDLGDLQEGRTRGMSINTGGEGEACGKGNSLRSTPSMSAVPLTSRVTACASKKPWELDPTSNAKSLSGSG